jgi:hypothetical protein
LAGVNFEGGSDVPLPFSAAALDSLAPTLAQYPSRRYELHAYFCPGPDSGAAQRAGVERMKSVGNFLVANGVPTGNIAAVKAGYAEAGPCARVAIVAVDAQQAETAPAELATATTESAEAEPEPDAAPPPAEAQGKPTVAIYTAGEEPPAAKGVHHILGGELARTISESGKYLAIDRTEEILSSIAKEHIYQRDGAVDDDQIKALGQQLGAQYLCISNINPTDSRSYYLDIRLVDVVTAEIIRTATANSTLKDANEKTRVARELAYELIETEKAIASRKRKKMITLTTAISADVLGVSALMYGFIENNNVRKYNESQDYPDGERSVTMRNAAYVVGSVLIAAGVSVHILF